MVDFKINVNDPKSGKTHKKDITGHLANSLIGKKLGEAGFRKVVDRSILVTHRTTETLGEYWRVRETRGRFSVLTQGCLLQYSVGFLLIRLCAKDIIRILEVLLVLPAAWRIYMITRESREPTRDLFAVIYGYFLQMLARAVGEWKGMRVLIAHGPT